MSGVPQWVWGAYYALSVYFIVNGGYSIFKAFAITHEKIMGQEIGFGFLSIILIALGSLNILLGLGLLFQIQAIRNIVNFVLGIQILFGILGIVMGLPTILNTGFLGFVSLMMQVLQVAAAAFMVYLIGETDRVAPSL
jgi:hypothetical protein